MQPNKIEVTYFFRKPRPQYHSIERVFGLIIENLPENIVPKIHKLSGGEKGYFSRFKALLEARKNKGKINHITGDISYVALALPRKGLVITFHDLESLERNNRLISQMLKWFWVKIPARRASVITVISEHTKKQVMEWAKVPESKIKVIPNPLPKGFEYSPKPTLSEPPVILAVGTKSNKNLEGIITALEGLRCQLLIVGKLNNAQFSLLKKKEIIYENLTGVTDQQIIEAYKFCDVLCFPSFFEGFGMPIIEAQATGRPVITSNYGAMKEVAGEGAVLVDPYSPNDIKNALLKVIEDATYRNELIRKGQENAGTHQPLMLCGHYSDIYELFA